MLVTLGNGQVCVGLVSAAVNANYLVLKLKVSLNHAPMDISFDNARRCWPEYLS
jgi:hypothetical protein